MNILIVGNGGREHALGWKISQSRHCGRLFFAPGNCGTAELGENLSIDVDLVDTAKVDEIDYFCRHQKVELIVIGPEGPLAGGLAGRLARPGRTVFGPTGAAARIEADKAYSKQLMRTAAIPTAEARIFDSSAAAISFVEAHETPVVVKAAGLAKGKGVIVCNDRQEAVNAVELIMRDRIFDTAGDTVVIEERLVGQEVSILALVDGRNLFVLDAAQDHKQVGEGDVGPNTGGMGAYCPAPLVDDTLMREIEKQILVPAIDAMRRDGIEYRGVLYAGLMLTAGGPKVIEFNCRFGDPEVQALLMRWRGDLVDVMLATAQGKLDAIDMTWDPRCCCCCVVASGGYPGDYRKGLAISGLEAAKQTAPGDIEVFHAGTAMDGDQLVTAGGRVLDVCALGDDLRDAQQKANRAAEQIRFEGAFFRRDIGFRVMSQEPVA